MEIIGTGKVQIEKKKDRYYSMTIGIKEYLCQIIDEETFITFRPTPDSKTHRETIKSFKPESSFIIIKNVVWLVPTSNGDAPIDYDSLSTGSDEVVVNASAIQKLNLLPDRVSEEIAQEKRAAKLGIMTPNAAAVEMSSRKGGTKNER